MKLISMQSIMAKLDLDRTTIHKMIANGEFIQGYGEGRLKRWSESEVDAFCIIFWEINKNLPKLPEEKLQEIRKIAQNAKIRRAKSTPTRKLKMMQKASI